MKTIILRPTDDGCAREIDGLRGSYVNGRVIAAVLDLTAFDHEFALYEKEVLKARKGVWSDITRARRLGYYVQEYAHRRWLDDVARINLSKPVRSGGPMRDSYKRSVAELGGVDPNAIIVPPMCAQHWRATVGVFHPFHEITPGDHRETLVAYSSIVKTDELLIVSMFLAHAEHLRAGVAHALLREIVRRACETGASFVLYGSSADGGPGLTAWKRRLGFLPTRLVAAERVTR